MANNLFETQYDLTKKSKLKEFYESNKIWIYSTIFAFIIIIASYGFYKDSHEKKKILMSEKYIQAKVYLENGNKKFMSGKPVGQAGFASARATEPRKSVFLEY